MCILKRKNFNTVEGDCVWSRVRGLFCSRDVTHFFNSVLTTDEEAGKLERRRWDHLKRTRSLRRAITLFKSTQTVLHGI